jgi:hypothetical protein
MQTGDLIAYQYQLIQPMHTSWLATDQISGQHCLLKPSSSFADPQVAHLLEKIWHAGLPRLLSRVWIDQPSDDGTQPGQEQLVFEYRPGRSLRDLAAENSGRMPIGQLLPLIRQSAAILAYLHRQGERPVLHLDIKPDHLLLGPDGKVSLIDFGAARFFDQAADLSDDPGGSGQRNALTPEFAAPEQIAGRPCPGSDIYSLGLTLLHLLSGHPAAFCRSHSLREVLPAAPPGLLGLVGRCLHADPAVRLSDAREFYDLLTGEITSSEQIQADMISLQDGLAGTNCSEGPAREEGSDFAGAAGCIISKDDDNGIKDEKQQTGQMPAPLLCVWGNPEFGCELAGVLSSMPAGKQEILVIDADLLNPQADLLLGCKSEVPAGMVEYHAQGLDLALTDEQRGHLDMARLAGLAQPTQLARVKLLATRASLDHYDYFSLDSLNQILRLSRLICGLVIVLCSQFIFDAFTCLSTLAADQVLVPRPGDSGSFRACSRSLRVLAARYQLDLAKVWFVAFDYQSRTDLSWGTLSELSDNRLAGCVTARENRRTMKCGAQPFAAALDRTSRNEYISIIRHLHLNGNHKYPAKEQQSCLW